MIAEVHGSFSEWFTVLSGVPQGSLLGLLLFLIFVNDLLDSGFGSKQLSTFADDTKIWRGIHMMEDQESLLSWSDKWLLKLNPEKCKLIPCAYWTWDSRVQTEYEMTEKQKRNKLQVSQEETNVRAIYWRMEIISSLVCSEPRLHQKQCQYWGWSGEDLGKLAREVSIYCILYKSYVQPHMKHCVQARSPYLVKEIECLENVHQRATKMVRGLDHMPYDKWLKVLGLCSYEHRHLRGDLIEVYKIFSVNKATFFQLSPTVSTFRGHSMKLFYHKPDYMYGLKYFFSHRVVPQSTVCRNTLFTHLQWTASKILHAVGESKVLLCPYHRFFK